jgi:hypothetical protein
MFSVRSETNLLCVYCGYIYISRHNATPLVYIVYSRSVEGTVKSYRQINGFLTVHHCVDLNLSPT